VIRRILWLGLVAGPLVVALDAVSAVSKTVLFALAAVSLVPLAWLIGEATENLSERTGPGIGGFLNATFGNAPELIIALFAVANGLAGVVRGSLTGSIVGNLLLVLGASLVFGRGGRIDRVSSFTWVGLVAAATLLFLIPSAVGWGGASSHHVTAISTVPVAVVLLACYLAVTWQSLRRHHLLHTSDLPREIRAWPLSVSLAALVAATTLTAFVAEIVVHTIDTFASHAHLSEFFVAAVIVAIAGNAAEHGGAIVVAMRGHVRLASEIALSSSAQVAVFLIPLIALFSWAMKPLALSFRPVEIAALAASAALVGALLAPGRTDRLRGVALLLGYAAIAVAFYLAGRG
jgi:Ca2+:H+ antiporter